MKAIYETSKETELVAVWKFTYSKGNDCIFRIGYL